jgi:hypothetical protein
MVCIVSAGTMIVSSSAACCTAILTGILPTNRRQVDVDDDDDEASDLKRLTVPRLKQKLQQKGFRQNKEAALALFPLGPFVALAQSDNKEKGERKPLLGPACSEKESVGSPILLSPNYHGPEMLCIARNIYGWNCGA